MTTDNMIWFYRRKQENLISFSLLPAAFSASRLFADICKYIIIFLFNPPDYTQICDIAPNCLTLRPPPPLRDKI